MVFYMYARPADLNLSGLRVGQEAVAEMSRLCRERGFLQGDGSVCIPTNTALIVTATA